MNTKLIIPPNSLWLSPMEGVSDLGFRKICFDRGAKLTFTEMIRADSLAKGNKSTLELIDTYIQSIPTGIQLLVSKPDLLRKVLNLITQQRTEKITQFMNISAIDLNFGCPSPEIISQGSGPALLKRTARMRELLTILKELSPVPCGIKIRLGLNAKEKKEKVYLNVIKIANEVKLDWITVHPKTADQKSTDPIDLAALKEIAACSSIPIIGNGLVANGPQAKQLLDLGCRGVMIARGAIVNPWIFEEINYYLKTGEQKSFPKNYKQAYREYRDIALKYNTKKKYIEYHHQTFLQHLAGDLSYHSPSNIRKWN